MSHDNTASWNIKTGLWRKLPARCELALNILTERGNIDIMRTFKLVKLNLGRWKTIISSRLSFGLFTSEKCVDIQCFAKSMSRQRQFFTTTFKQFIDDRQLCLWLYVHEEKYACSMLLSTENIWHLFLLTLIINW